MKKRQAVVKKGQRHQANRLVLRIINLTLIANFSLDYVIRFNYQIGFPKQF